MLIGQCRTRTQRSCGQGYEAFNEAWDRGDAALLEAWFGRVAAPEFEYVPSGAVPDLRSISPGYEGFLGFLEGFWGDFEEAHVEPEELIDAGDGVLAVVRFHGKGTPSGAEVEMTVCQLWTLRDGKVIRGQGFFARGEALEAAGLTT
jgi:ketosteroid isomerase-like protein